MKTFRYVSSFLLVLFVISGSVAQVSPDSVQSYIKSTRDYRKGKNIKLMYSEATPLTPEQHQNFKGLNYFEPDINFCVIGKIEKAVNPETIVLRTSTDRAPEYVDYGTIHFSLAGENYELKAYQSKKLLDVAPDDSTLFIPFRDLTSGKETYGGGRYIDVILPDSGNQVIIDFNKSYNPYCAYNPRYSCVIPPEENRLPVAIEAGEKIFEEH